MNLRDDMPETAAHVDQRRAEWGAEWVNACITRGHVRREPGWFYAIEGGHVIGAPFTADQVTDDLIRKSVALGLRFVCMLRPPDDNDKGRSA